MQREGTNMNNIIDYGAVADGVTVCTRQIQRAIDLCEKGGTVYIPKGVFRSGALYLKSNMTLHFEEGAKLLGSDEISDFPVKGFPFEGMDQLCYSSLLNTDGARYENITIEGKGIIDANGRALFEAELGNNPKVKRGRCACLRHITNLTIKDVTFRQSPAWCLHLAYCTNVVIDGIEVRSKYDEKGNKYDMHNCDGIDLDCCQNVHVTNSLIASQDDSIAIKSGRDEEGRRVGIPSKDILIENCRFTAGFGVAVGSEMSGGVENVWVKNCTFNDVFSIASLKAVRGRGNYIRNIHYENCTLTNHSTEYTDTKWFRGALYIDGFYGQDEFDADTPVEIDDGTPIIEDIYFEDIELDTIAGNAIYLCGLPERHYRNINFKNVTAHGKYGMKVKNIDELHKENLVVTYECN